MAIPVPFPHMSLNAEALPAGPFLMWNTWIVPWGTTVEKMLGWTAEVARTSPWGKLETVVFNSHGCGGRMLIGEGFKRRHTPKFAVLKGLVNQIWLCGCSVARIEGSGDNDVLYSCTNDGNLFCCEIAKASGAFVTAPTGLQKGEKNVKYGHIDDWEGTVLTYGPLGNVVAVKNY